MDNIYMSKCEDVFNDIISEDASVANNNVRYKAYGFADLVEDDYEDGQSDRISSIVLEEVFNRTPEAAIIKLAHNYGLHIKTDEMEYTEVNGKSEFQGSYSSDKKGNYIDVTEDPQLFEDWKNGNVKIYAINYSIIVQKLTYSNIDQAEIDRINQAFK